MARVLTAKKARKILKHGSVRGHKLTAAQRGMFGAKAGGKKLIRLKKKTTKK